MLSPSFSTTPSSVGVSRRELRSSFEAIPALIKFLAPSSDWKHWWDRTCYLDQNRYKSKWSKYGDCGAQVILQISTTSNMAWSIFQRWIDHCYAAESNFRASRYMAASGVLMLVAIYLTVCSTDHQQLCNFDSTARIDYIRLVPSRPENDLEDVSARLGRQGKSMGGVLLRPSVLSYILLETVMASIKLQGRNLSASALGAAIQRKQELVKTAGFQPGENDVSLFLYHSSDSETIWQKLYVWISIIMAFLTLTPVFTDWILHFFRFPILLLSSTILVPNTEPPNAERWKHERHHVSQKWSSPQVVQSLWWSPVVNIFISKQKLTNSWKWRKYNWRTDTFNLGNCIV